MEFLIAFLIAFGFASPSDKDALLKDSAKVESIYKSSNLSNSQFEAYKKKIIEMEDDGM